MVKKILELATDVKYDATEERWVASALDSSGKTSSVKAKSPTQAVRRLTTVLEKDYERPLILEPRLHVPREEQAAYNEFERKLRQFLELRDYINKARKELGFRFVDKYDMPITTVAPLLGLSAQRFGMLKQEWEMGITRGSVGRPRKNQDDED